MAKNQASFDVVSKLNDQEIKNAVRQAEQEMQTRFDLKGSYCEIQMEPDALVLVAEDEIKLRAVDDILATRLAKRKVPLEALDRKPVESVGGGRSKRRIELQQGIPKEKAKEIAKIIKGLKIKVQAQIMDDCVRVTGKSRDDLQEVMGILRGAKLGIHMEFTNYRN